MSTDDGPGPELSRNLVYLLKHAHLRMAELTANALTPYGIEGRELGVLLVLAGREPESQQRAAQRLGIDRTTMVALLDALEAKGLVSRHPDAEDRRRNLVGLTAAGNAALRRAVEASDNAEREFLARLSPEAAEQLRRSLLTVITDPGG
nr:MarR family transcriptional regulator [Micromonospora sp. DSM 115978]